MENNLDHGMKVEDGHFLDPRDDIGQANEDTRQYEHANADCVDEEVGIAIEAEIASDVQHTLEEENTNMHSPYNITEDKNLGYEQRLDFHLPLYDNASISKGDFK